MLLYVDIELLELLELSGFNDAIVPQVEKLDSIHLSQGSALFKLEEVGELRIVCGSVSLDILSLSPKGSFSGWYRYPTFKCDYWPLKNKSSKAASKAIQNLQLHQHIFE